MAGESGMGSGGFAAKFLRRAPVDVTLIDRTNHHLFQPLLYQLATAILSEGGLTRWRSRLASMKSEHATYRLVVRGELDARFAYLFEGMQLERTEGTTLISGPVRDQAHLHGLIERVEELGLELISVQQVGTGESGSSREVDEVRARNAASQR